MEIISKLLGKIEFEEQSIIAIPEGLIGISGNRRFILIEKEDLNPFVYLQSVDDPDFSLVVINPFLADNSYMIDIDPSDLEAIGAKEQEDFIVLSIVVLADRIEHITVNLKAPIIINVKSQKGKQIILQTLEYGVADPLVKRHTIDSAEQQKKEES